MSESNVADFGRGFKDDGDGNAECREHGKAFLGGQIGEGDVGETICLACVDPDELSRRGRAMLTKMRGDRAAEKVIRRG